MDEQDLKYLFALPDEDMDDVENMEALHPIDDNFQDKYNQIASEMQIRARMED